MNLGNWLEADVFETHGFHACVGILLFGKILEDTIFNNLTSVFLQESL